MLIEINADYRDDDTPQNGSAFRGLFYGFAFTLAGIAFVYFIISVMKAL